MPASDKPRLGLISSRAGSDAILAKSLGLTRTSPKASLLSPVSRAMSGTSSGLSSTGCKEKNTRP